MQPPPPTPSVSTRSLRSGTPLEERAGQLLDLGVEGLVLDPELREPLFRRIVAFYPPRSLRALSLFAPLPAPVGARRIEPPRMASLDRDEQRECVKRGTQGIETAARHEIPRVIVPCGSLIEPDDDAVARAIERGPSEEVWERLRKQRDAADSTRQQLDSVLRVLSELLAAGERHEVEIDLVPAGLPSEVPDWAEVAAIEEEFRGARLGVFLDVPRRERAARSGDRRAVEALAAPPDSLSGVLFHDGRVFEDHLTPGSGDVDFEALRSLAASPRARELEWTLDLAENATIEDCELARERLQRLFRPPPSQKPPPFLDTSSFDLV